MRLTSQIVKIITSRVVNWEKIYYEITKKENVIWSKVEIGETLTCGEYERDVKFRNYAKWKISKEEKKTKGRQNDTGGN